MHGWHDTLLPVQIVHGYLRGFEVQLSSAQPFLCTPESIYMLVDLLEGREAGDACLSVVASWSPMDFAFVFSHTHISMPEFTTLTFGTDAAATSALWALAQVTPRDRGAPNKPFIYFYFISSFSTDAYRSCVRVATICKSIFAVRKQGEFSSQR